MIKDLTLEQFQAELRGKNPTPGGGVVAAIAGQLSASLIEMVCNLTIEKKGYEDVQKEILKFREQASKSGEILGQLAERDQKAFNEVMAAYRLPKEDLTRQAKIILALKEATEIPTQVKKQCQSLSAIAKKIAQIGNRNAISDAKTAIYLSEAGAKSAQENISINQQSLNSLSSK